MCGSLISGNVGVVRTKDDLVGWGGGAVEVQVRELGIGMDHSINQFRQLYRHCRTEALPLLLRAIRGKGCG
jgi:hypothetical protein